MKYLIMMPVLAMSLMGASYGPCACMAGKLCTWTGTGYNGSHTEYAGGNQEHPGETTTARSILNKTFGTLVVSGRLAGTQAVEKSYCLDLGAGVKDTGADFLLERTATSPAPCAP